MANAKFYNSNLATDILTEITASSENAFFPASNVRDHRTTKEWRSATGVTSANLIFDFKTPEAINSVLVKGSQLDGFGFTSMTIEANATSDFTSPAFSTTLTPSFEFNFGLKTFTDETFRFWRISVSGGSPYVSISNIFIGSFIQMTSNNIDLGWIYSDDDASATQRNRLRQEFKDVIIRQTSLGSLTINVMNKTEVDQILQIYDENGVTVPVWVVIDESETIINDFERFAGQFFLTRVPSVTNGAFSLYDTVINVREVI